MGGFNQVVSHACIAEANSHMCLSMRMRVEEFGKHLDVCLCGVSAAAAGAEPDIQAAQ